MSNRSRDSLHLSAQLNSEWQRSGINFRIMLVGESGLGKSTFTRALLRPYVPDHLLDAATSIGAGKTLRGRTTEITEINHNVDNDGFPVEFTIVDCPGYAKNWMQDDHAGYRIRLAGMETRQTARLGSTRWSAT